MVVRFFVVYLYQQKQTIIQQKINVMNKTALKNQEQAQIAKVNKIFRAIEKAKSIYKGFVDFSEAFLYPAKLSEFERDFAREISNTFKWNEVNDLIDRLEDKYWDAVSELDETKFKLYGFVAY